MLWPLYHSSVWTNSEYDKVNNLRICGLQDDLDYMLGINEKKIINRTRINPATNNKRSAKSIKSKYFSLISRMKSTTFKDVLIFLITLIIAPLIYSLWFLISLAINFHYLIKCIQLDIPFRYKMPYPIGATVLQSSYGVKIEIYHNEHPPPHFHVRNYEFNVSISIENGEILRGKLDGRNLKIVRKWYKKNKPRLIKVWNETRPDNCPVGKIII